MRKTKYKGEDPEGDWLNYTVKVTIKWIDQLIIEMFLQHFIISEQFDFSIVWSKSDWRKWSNMLTRTVVIFHWVFHFYSKICYFALHYLNYLNLRSMYTSSLVSVDSCVSNLMGAVTARSCSESLALSGDRSNPIF